MKHKGHKEHKGKEVGKMIKNGVFVAILVALREITSANLLEYRKF